MIVSGQGTYRLLIAKQITFHSIKVNFFINIDDVVLVAEVYSSAVLGNVYWRRDALPIMIIASVIYFVVFKRDWCKLKN